MIVKARVEAPVQVTNAGDPHGLIDKRAMLWACCLRFGLRLGRAREAETVPSTSHNFED